MATSSIPAAIDWLVTNARQLAALAAPAAVYDGWPDGRADTALVVGVTPDDAETGNSPVWAQVGAQTTWEQVAIPCVIWAYAGGSSMQAARNAAFGVMNALDGMLRTDPTLGGAVRSGAALLTNVRVMQTGDASEAGDGRTCEIRCEVVYKSRSTA
jgi:hypothetical protein